MSGIKIILLNPKRPKADATCPLAIRVTVNRKQLYMGDEAGISMRPYPDPASSCLMVSGNEIPAGIECFDQGIA